MKRYAGLIILIITTLSAAAEDTPRSSMRKGLKFYKAGDYTNAVQQLEKTALEFPDTGHYNLGNALYRKGDFEAAADAFNEALRSEDLALQAKAYFNRGCALLAQTTVLSGPEQMAKAIELAFQGMDMFEKAILLNPDDLESKQNFERAAQLRLNLEYNQGKMYFDHAEALLSEFKAKDAQKNYRSAKRQFEHILANVDPHHGESQQYLPKIDERMNMLDRALASAEQDLETALKQIEDYQYTLAAQRLTTESDERKYAFDLKPELKKQYEETIQKNQQVLEIIQALTNLNTVQ